MANAIDLVDKEKVPNKDEGMPLDDANNCKNLKEEAEGT